MRTKFFCNRTLWNGRQAYELGNGMVRLIALLGGGHIADFRLHDGPDVSPLWVAPWKTIEPYRYREKRHRGVYGRITEGKLLSGLAGHNICLDYFGSPSVEEARQGLSQHGEAPCSKWTALRSSTAEGASLRMSVGLPIAGLSFTREIMLRKDEPIAYFNETVINRHKADYFFHWAQHVTLGLPFLDPTNAFIFIPADKAMTYPHGYDEGRALLESGKEFRWPEAPLADGGKIDLSRPFLRRGLGFVVAALLKRDTTLGVIAAVNSKLGLLVAYFFKRIDFPWVAVWEENLGITAPPWKQRTRARGLEFSTTPFPLLRRESFFAGRLFDEGTLTFVPAMGTKTIRYGALLTRVPANFTTIRSVEVCTGKLRVFEEENAMVTIRSEGIDALFN